MANADTVTMSATLKVDGVDTPIQINDIPPIDVDVVDNYNLVIFYNGKYYGSESFDCKYFDGMTINFNVSNDKDEEKKTVTTGDGVVVKPSGNFVRIKCDGKSKFYDVSEVASNNNSVVRTDEIVLEEVDIKNADTLPAQATGSQTNKVSKWSKLRNRLSEVNKDNKDNNDNFTEIISKGGKRSRKAYLKSGRKSGRKASRKASRTAYRKLGRKSVGNKKRNRGTRKK